MNEKIWATSITIIIVVISFTLGWINTPNKWKTEHTINMDNETKEALIELSEVAKIEEGCYLTYEELYNNGSGFNPYNLEDLKLCDYDFH